MNTRSIHFRLISWYTALIIIICVGFGLYTYNGLNNYLKESLHTIMKRRAAVIGRGVLTFYPQRDSNYIAKEIDTIFSPQENNRFIRITDENDQIIYVSGTPENKNFYTSNIPLPQKNFTDSFMREIAINDDIKLMILSTHFEMPQGQIFTIEVGNTTESINDILHELLKQLSLGLSFVLILAVGGGYILVQKSLRPVENLRVAAENISLKNLKERLPVLKSSDCIEYLSITLNKMIDRLDNAYRQLEHAYQQSSRFSADASHELRTPLTVMRGELESIIMEPSMPIELRDRLGTILEETERLSMISEGLFAISRLDAGEAKKQIVSVNLSHLVKSTFEQMKLLADEKNITTVCKVHPKVEVEGDPARLKQIVVNLIDNAIKYTHDKGRIVLKVYAENTKAIIEIADNGIGIPFEDKSKIFERFYRADKVRSRSLGGAGLGLSIVQSICAAHDGSIRVDSTEGKGSCFIVELPIVSA